MAAQGGVETICALQRILAKNMDLDLSSGCQRHVPSTDCREAWHSLDGRDRMQAARLDHVLDECVATMGRFK
jgi:hypothetical protein